MRSLKVIHLPPFAMPVSGCSPAPAENPAERLDGTASTAVTTICELVWMTRNLDVVTYRTGEPIPQLGWHTVNAVERSTRYL